MGNGSVLIVGGGIAGVQAALDLANAGFFVYLLEKRPAIGGVMAQLDKTFPTNDCSMCILSPKLVEIARNQNIKLLTLAEVYAVSGKPGDFLVKIRRYPRYIDESKCIACGQCAAKCPKKVPNEFDKGLSFRKAIYLLYPQAVPLKYAIDPENCIALKKPGRCGFCIKACPSGAIDFTQKIEELEIKVGALLLAPGFDTFNPEKLDQYGYGKLPQVMTAHEFERLLSASGPTRGALIRLSDGKIPRKIAWIQCIGSRDINRAKIPYCSSICCMYALKQALIAKEHVKEELSTTIFYMDMRTMGKGFEEYLNRARNQGVRLIRSRIHSILPYLDGVLINYLDEKGVYQEELFDLVVLSVGIKPSKGGFDIARACAAELDSFGFLKENFLENQPGIFVCGEASGPKDIPDTVAEASAAAAKVETFLAKARFSETKEKTYPPEKFVFPDPPKIGVFVCHCGLNIASVVDVKEVARFAAGLPDVCHVEDNLFTCSEDTIQKIGKAIEEKGLNRIVVAACTPRTHEPLFQETLRAVGLNCELFEMANIRDQDSWVHPEVPNKATQKAKELVAMAVNRVRLKKPVSVQSVKVNKRGLVIGGGLAGMQAALSLAEQGFPVTLVEESEILGGYALRVFRKLYGQELPVLALKLAENIEKHPLIDLRLKTKVTDVSGSVGQFETKLSNGNIIKHGIAILATGAHPYIPEGPYSFGYKKSSNIKTSLELDILIKTQPEKINEFHEIIFIQCVGSRIPERPYCSRICCTHTMEQIIKLKEINPELKIFVLYRDIRTYGKKEILYQKARELGAVFIRYELDSLPEIIPGNSLKLKIFDPVINRHIQLHPELIVLATAVVPRKSGLEVAKLFKCATTSQGFMLEAHQKLRPVDFATEGVFMAGLCHYPKPAEESLRQALAAAARAATILSQKELPLEPIVAESDPRKCSACGQCVAICPYQAIDLEEIKPFGLVSVVNTSLCKGCGNCTATCRSGALKLKNLDEETIIASIEASFGRLWY